ncbi:unnamed protein product [Phaedon cochleariae]|uniref:Tetratricopeptide repeat protein n=1 Tax=Phaedon cochleariae TaxID=80249 RepID=A0A9N9X3S7_PHACE|nr:unnamed protein product [Phaedon cochleariae]
MLTESGILHLKEGQSQQAFERLSSALALEPAFPKALLGIGYITQKHREFDVALTKYKTAIHYQPDSVALWNNIGMCFYAKQKYVASFLQSGIFPKLLKQTELTPIHEKGDENDIHNYRAIAVLNCVAKLFEFIFFDKMY